MLRTLFCLMLLLLPVVDAWAQAQTASTEFEVASLRPNNESEGAALVQATPGRVSMTKISLQRLLLIAYDLKDYQLVGVPAWAESKRYDLIAKSSDDASVERMEGPMLRALLEDRFKMKVHRETRALPLYELVVSKGGRSCTARAREAASSTINKHNRRRPLEQANRSRTIAASTGQGPGYDPFWMGRA